MRDSSAIYLITLIYYNIKIFTNYYQVYFYLINKPIKFFHFIIGYIVNISCFLFVIQMYNDKG